MKEDAERYMTEIVDPTIRDFEANPTSKRLAFLACAATFHAIDHLTHPESSANRRNDFCRESSAFATADRVAHAFKHVETGHVQHPTIKPLKADGVIERPPALWGVAVWDLSRWDDAVGGVTLDKEREVDLLSVIREVADFIRQQIAKEPWRVDLPE